MRNSRRKGSSDEVRVLQRKHYGCFCKIFCCKCIYCCQSIDFSLLTSEHRKDVFQKMIKKYVTTIEKEENVVIDPFFILVGLLLGQKNSQITSFTLLEMGPDRKRSGIFSKEDLEKYIPQLCTYLVFHEEMENIPIFNILQTTSCMDLQFGLLYYSYMKSLEVINHNTEFKIVKKYNETFLNKINLKFPVPQLGQQPQQEQKRAQQIIEKYQSGHKIAITEQKLEFMPEFRYFQNEGTGIFKSSIIFLDQLVELGWELLRETNDRRSLFQSYLKDINKSLPAEVYLPFRSKKYRQMALMNIVVEQCKVFSTKERAPFYICAEMVHKKVFSTNQHQNKRVRSTEENTGNLRRSQLFIQDELPLEQEQMYTEQSLDGNNGWFSHSLNKLVDRAKELYGSDMHNSVIYKLESQENIDQFFNPCEKQIKQNIGITSPYSRLPQYTIAHFMIKTNDDLRQQSFAMQLLQEFNTIFKMQNLPARVFPYEVIPLGHDFGIIQFLKDTITFDELYRREGNLEFVMRDSRKCRNFMNSLVGYCVVTYLLQVKDRHNGNILINRDGSIVHIDYGFFMSNSPGKGVELEKNVAFKMTPEYLQVMGGLKSKNFQQFRKLFFLCYQACRKHQHRILILSKLMYSSHGTTMPCFEKGNQAIEDLEDRLNPPGIRTDGDLSLFCQNIVNKTIDNWRGRWYDKWQYYMQGILY